jgi:hypothetical protein
MRNATSKQDVLTAIESGTAFITTFTGRHKVVGIRPNQDCNIVTNNSGKSWDQQGWAASYDQIEIDG